ASLGLLTGVLNVLLIWCGSAHSDNRRSSGWRFVEIGGCAVQDRRCDGGPLALSIARDGQLLLEASRQSGSLSATVMAVLPPAHRVLKNVAPQERCPVHTRDYLSGSGSCPLTS